MMSVTIPRVAAATAVIGAIVLVQLARAPGDVSSPAPVEVAPPPAHEGLAAPAAAEPAAAPSETPAAAKQRELEAMSETFRNTTFLIAIRAAGFVCHELLRVVGGLDGSSKWLASCSEMQTYTIGVASDGTLHVEPMLQYFDGIAPSVDQRFDSGDRPVLPPQSLPPQPLPQR
jgi:hypothetical protein